MWYGGSMGGWGYALMILTTVAFWAVLISGAVAVLRYLNRSQPGAGRVRSTPQQLLAERFARGEVDEDEYRRRLDALRAAESDRLRR